MSLLKKIFGGDDSVESLSDLEKNTSKNKYKDEEEEEKEEEYVPAVILETRELASGDDFHCAIKFKSREKIYVTELSEGDKSLLAYSLFLKPETKIRIDPSFFEDNFEESKISDNYLSTDEFYFEE
jgi:hypothetical protein